MTAKRDTMQWLRRINVEYPQFARWFLNKLLNVTIAGFMMLHQIGQRLQATVAQRAFHALEPLRRVVHLRRHGADDDQRLSALPRRLFHRNRITDPASQV